MERSEYHAGKPPRRELQGPRPTPLKVRKDSHKIKKPLVPAGAPPPPPPPPPQHRQPAIIYIVSPKVIHTKASDFMMLVQHLTGTSSSSSSSSRNPATEALSPAARLATIEKTGNSGGEKAMIGDLESMDWVGMDTAKLDRSNYLHGILSPLPSALPPISPSVFLPSPDSSSLSIFHELSSGSLFSSRNYSESGLFPSPSTLFSAPIPSPNPELFSHFFDF